MAIAQKEISIRQGRGLDSEMVGKGVKMVDSKCKQGAVWVAVRIPTVYIRCANHARITTFPLNDPENCLYAPDVIDLPGSQSVKGKDKDFAFLTPMPRWTLVQCGQ